jgi:hypothetical protein
MSGFAIYFTLSNVPLTRQYTTRQNVKKYTQQVRYQGYIDEENIGCSYIGVKDISPPSNLSIIQLEDSVPENTYRAFSGSLEWVGDFTHVFSQYFQITDEFADVVSSTPIPFFWKHILPNADIDPDSVVILNEDLTEIPEYSYKVEQIPEYNETTGTPISGSYSECVIYSNIQNSYNPKTGEVLLYFVRYEAYGQTHFSLLNSELIFTEATLDDISTVTSQLKPWKKVYILTQVGDRYKLRMPKSDVLYRLKFSDNGRISILDPFDLSDEEPWFLRVTNGNFLRSVSSEVYNYSIPEYAIQDFNPIKPYKLVSNEKAAFIRGDIIKVDKTPLQTSTSFYVLEVLIKDRNDTLLYALTTETDRDGDYYEEEGVRFYRTLETDNAYITWDTSGILSWDVYGGFIHLSKNYNDTYNFYASYYYKEEALEYTSLNLNPLFDATYNNQFHVMYAVPVGGGNDNSGQTNAVQYIKVDANGRVTETSQDGSGNNFDFDSLIPTDSEYPYYDRTASSTVSEEVSAPTTTLKVDNTNSPDFPSHGALHIGDDISLPGDVVIGYSSYTTVGNDLVFSLSNTLNPTISVGTNVELFSFKDTFSSDGSNRMQWLPLAQININATSTLESLSLIDVRKRGGAIKEEYYSDAMDIDPRSVWARPEMFPGRGQVIPGDSIAVVKLPFTLLEDYGGRFSHKTVETIVRRHMATGVMPAIIYECPIPAIESAMSSTDSITITWQSEGDDLTYNVYYAGSKDGPWYKHNRVPIVGGTYIYTNVYHLDRLTADTRYYISLTSVDQSGIESPKSVVWAIGTATVV